MKKIILCLLIAISSIANAQYTQLLSFNGAVNGSQPYGTLVSDGTFLYGMTRVGGTNDFGTIFKILPNGTGYIKLLDFNGNANGRNPYGALISDGTFFYGMTTQGGANGIGTIFKIMPDGTGFSLIHEFDGTGNGDRPRGSLVYDGTFLYGMTPTGGTTNKGTIFKIMPNGTGFVKLYDFNTTNQSSTSGSLIYDGTFLYGMSTLGGTNSAGTIFKIMPDGTGYVKLHDFDGTANGSSPNGSLISDGTFLYGVTEAGGINSAGIIFKILLNGTGFVKLLDFAFAPNGGFPHGSLISDGTFLYGMAFFGGINNKGTIFKIMLDGTGFSKLHDFDATTGGSSPDGSLISDGTFLYGMTSLGGTNSIGTIFKLQNPTTNITAEQTLEPYFIIHPNPSNGMFTITSNGKKQDVEITNIHGEIVYSFQMNSNKSEINLINQAKGIYFLKIIDDAKIHVKKIVIQ